MESLTPQEIDRIIEMAWEDRTPFDAIEKQFNLKESDVIALMRRELLPKSFERWRKRVSGRATKHLKKRTFTSGTFKCDAQRMITGNRISKR